MQKLLAAESYDEPTEIVIHVNMLKEGWDVTNLYTIVPLRAANARTLIEQSIGRGLRLPYGRKTGVDVVDRLNIIAHDKFQEVVDEAGRGDSPIRLKQLKLDPAGDAGGGLRSVAVTPTINTLLGIGLAVDASGATSKAGAGWTYPLTGSSTTALYTGERANVAQVAMDVINDLSRLNRGSGDTETSLPTSAALARADVQAQVLRRVEALVTPAQTELLLGQDDGVGPSVADIVKKTMALVAEHSIDIPRILVKPKGAVRTGYKPFALDLSKMNFQPQDQQLVGRGQGKAIAENIHAQMARHYFEDMGEYEVVVMQGFAPLKASAVTTEGDVLPLHQPPADRSRIAAVVYGGFTRCAYTCQKFHSDTERVLAQILERDALRWFRPVQGQFNIYYRRGTEQPEYVPDFAAATPQANLLIETKRVTDIDTVEVKAKAEAALLWCTRASAYSAQHGGKPWCYLLIPHDEVAVNRTLAALVAGHERKTG